MQNTPAQRPTWAEINLANLVFNFKSVKTFVGAEVHYMAVVKADGYGHGAVECARALEKENVDWFGVAIPEEGLQLRQAGILRPILCLGGFWEYQQNLIVENDLTTAICRLENAESLNNAAMSQNRTAKVHVKVDTGMGRIGVRFDEIAAFAEQLKFFSHLKVQGLMTHFAAADNLAENEFTNEQIRRFAQAVEIFEKKGFQLIYKDLANSPGAIAHKNARGNMVRLGGVLYGLGGDVLPKEIKKPELKPVMSVFSQVTLLKKVPKGESLGYSRTFTTKRDSLIATIPIGYHDGYPRLLSNRAQVIINGKKAPVVGRISMDWTIVDVTEIADVKIGDCVVLIGEQNGQTITAEELARKTDTISYEITCGINSRVVRRYAASE